MKRGTAPDIVYIAANTGESLTRPGTYWRQASMVGGKPPGFSS